MLFGLSLVAAEFGCWVRLRVRVRVGWVGLGWVWLSWVSWPGSLCQVDWVVSGRAWLGCRGGLR